MRRKSWIIGGIGLALVIVASSILIGIHLRQQGERPEFSYYTVSVVLTNEVSLQMVKDSALPTPEFFAPNLLLERVRMNSWSIENVRRQLEVKMCRMQ